jgi:integration host factor subunit alpha
MTMKKLDIVESAYHQLDIPKKDCVRLIDSLFEIIKDDLGKGKDVMISGFGKWTVKAKKKRKGRNPRTGEPITIDARKVVTFKPSRITREEVS